MYNCGIIASCHFVCALRKPMVGLCHVRVERIPCIIPQTLDPPPHLKGYTGPYKGMVPAATSRVDVSYSLRCYGALKAIPPSPHTHKIDIQLKLYRITLGTTYSKSNIKAVKSPLKDLHCTTNFCKDYIPLGHKTIRVGSWHWLKPPTPQFSIGNTNMLVPYLKTLKFALPPVQNIKFALSPKQNPNAS